MKIQQDKNSGSHLQYDFRFGNHEAISQNGMAYAEIIALTLSSKVGLGDQWSLANNDHTT